MSKDRNTNALMHGVYASDVILPWEKEDDFKALLAEVRKDLNPIGAVAEELAYEIACLYWKKRRLNRFAQIAFLESNFAKETEATGKRSVAGIRRALATQRRGRERRDRKLANAAQSLSQSLESLTDHTNGKGKRGVSKLSADLKAVMGEIETIRSVIQATAKSDATRSATDNSYGLNSADKVGKIDERIDSQIEKKIRLLIGMREYHRLYGQNSKSKVIEHKPTSAGKELRAHKVYFDPKRGKATSIGRVVDSSNDNDNDDCIDPEGYDSAHEYDQDVAEQAKKKP